MPMSNFIQEKGLQFRLPMSAFVTQSHADAWVYLIVPIAKWVNNRAIKNVWNVKPGQKPVQIQPKERIVEYHNSDEELINFLVQRQLEEILNQVNGHIDAMDKSVNCCDATFKPSNNIIQTDNQKSSIANTESDDNKNDMKVLWNNIDPFQLRSCEKGLISKTKTSDESINNGNDSPENHSSKLLDANKRMPKSSTKTLVNDESKETQIVRSTEKTVAKPQFNETSTTGDKDDSTACGDNRFRRSLSKLTEVAPVGHPELSRTNTKESKLNSSNAFDLPTSDKDCTICGDDSLDCSLSKLTEVNYVGQLDQSSTQTLVNRGSQKAQSNGLGLLKTEHILANHNFKQTSVIEDMGKLTVIRSAMNLLKRDAKQPAEHSQRNRALSLSISYDKMESVNINVIFQGSNRQPEVYCAHKTDAKFSRKAEHMGSDVNVHIALQGTNQCNQNEDCGKKPISVNERQHCNIRLALDSFDPPTCGTSGDMSPRIGKDSISGSGDPDLNMHFSLRSTAKTTADKKAAKRSHSLKSRKRPTTPSAVPKEYVPRPHLAAIPKTFLEDMYICLVHDGCDGEDKHLSENLTEEMLKTSSFGTNPTRSLLRNMTPNIKNEHGNLRKLNGLQYYNTSATASTGRRATPAHIQLNNTKLPRAGLGPLKTENPAYSKGSRVAVKYPAMKKFSEAPNTNTTMLPAKPVDVTSTSTKPQRNRNSKLCAQPKTESIMSPGLKASDHPVGEKVEANKKKFPFPSTHGAGDA